MHVFCCSIVSNCSHELACKASSALFETLFDKSIHENNENVERKRVCVVFLYTPVLHALTLRCLFILVATPGANRLFLLAALVHYKKTKVHVHVCVQGLLTKLFLVHLAITCNLLLICLKIFHL